MKRHYFNILAFVAVCAGTQIHALQSPMPWIGENIVQPSLGWMSKKQNDIATWWSAADTIEARLKESDKRLQKAYYDVRVKYYADMIENLKKAREVEDQNRAKNTAFIDTIADNELKVAAQYSQKFSDKKIAFIEADIQHAEQKIRALQHVAAGNVVESGWIPSFISQSFDNTKWLRYCGLQSWGELVPTLVPTKQGAEIVAKRIKSSVSDAIYGKPVNNVKQDYTLDVAMKYTENHLALLEQNRALEKEHMQRLNNVYGGITQELSKQSMLIGTLCNQEASAYGNCVDKISEFQKAVENAKNNRKDFDNNIKAALQRIADIDKNIALTKKELKKLQDSSSQYASQRSKMQERVNYDSYVEMSADQNAKEHAVKEAARIEVENNARKNSENLMQKCEFYDHYVDVSADQEVDLSASAIAMKKAGIFAGRFLKDLKTRSTRNDFSVHTNDAVSTTLKAVSVVPATSTALSLGLGVAVLGMHGRNGYRGFQAMQKIGFSKIVQNKMESVQNSIKNMIKNATNQVKPESFGTGDSEDVTAVQNRYKAFCNQRDLYRVWSSNC